MTGAREEILGRIRSALAEAWLLTIDTAGITVEPKGRLLVRIIAMAFDYYLQKDRQNDPVGRSRYSRVI